MVDRTKETVDGAVATTKGWVNPKTGELLVSIRGLSDAIAWTKGPIEVKAKKLKIVETAEDLQVDVSKLDDTDTPPVTLEVAKALEDAAAKTEVVAPVVEAPKVEVVAPVVEAPKVVKKTTKKTAKKKTDSPTE